MTTAEAAKVHMNKKQKARRIAELPDAGWTLAENVFYAWISIIPPTLEKIIRPHIEDFAKLVDMYALSFNMSDEISDKIRSYKRRTISKGRKRKTELVKDVTKEE